MSDTATVAPLPFAPCAAHPENPATGTCSRCGRFVCRADSRQIEQGLFCVECAQRPEVDYLEAFRLKYWGKRDSWAWLVGIGAVSNLAMAVALAVGGHWVDCLLMLVFCGVQGAFFFRVRLARFALPTLPLISVAAALAQPGEVAANVAASSVGSLFGVFISLLILQNTRNQLFFRIQPSPAKLKKAWDLYANNSVARMGFMLSLLGVLAFPLGPIALLCSILGLRNVNPNAHPPIGRKGQAITGIVLGSIETLGLVALLISLAFLD